MKFSLAIIFIFLSILLPYSLSSASGMERNVTIKWSMSDVTGVQSYKIYYSYYSDMANQKVACQTNDRTATELTCENVDIEKYPVYFTVAAVINGTESVSSPKEYLGSNQAPAISGFSAAPNPANNPHKKITFTVSASDGEGDPLSYNINFGDGTSSSSGSTVTHAYKSKGTYNVTATVSDNHGHSVSKTLQVVVNDNKPVKVTGVQAK